MVTTPARWARRSAALPIVLALALAGCAADKTTGGGAGSSPSPSKSGSVGKFAPGLINIADAGTAKDGGTLTFGGYAEPATLDPARTIMAGSTGGIEMSAVFDTLMRWDEKSQKVVPQLAKGLESSADAKTWTLTLRPDVKFSDGTPLDAAAVTWSIERYLASKGGDSVLWKRNVATMQAEGTDKVVFTLNSAWPTFDQLFTTATGMVVAKAAIGADGKLATPIGAGPYTFESRAPQENLVLKANPTYWGGKPKLDGIKFVYIPDPNALYDSFAKGSVDAAFFRDVKIVDKALTAKTPGYLQMVGIGNSALVNAAEGHPGADVRIRKAIQLAVDPVLTNQRATGGAGVVSSDLFSESSKLHSPDAKGLAHDPEEAKKLVAAAKADGFDGKITYLNGSSQLQKDYGMAFKAQLDAVGFDTTTEFVNSIGDVIAKVVKGDYDLSTWALSWRDAGPYARMFTTSHSSGTALYGTATSPEIDAVIEKMQAANGDEEQKKVAAELQKVWNEHVPAIVLGPTAEFVAFGPKVHGINSNTNTNILLDQAWRE